MQTRSEVSAGGVVYRRGDDRIELALAARRTRRGELAWGLPKGMIEPDETEEQAAVREVLEETGLVAEVEHDLGDIRYFYVWEGVRVRKRVRFFLMAATGGDVSNHDTEMEDVRWFSLQAARRRAAYKGEREMIERAADRLS
jgi:8-oxo-dGTP pyrophosphatase MutT (NUDIX family)